MTELAARSDLQKSLAATSDELIEQLIKADEVVIGLPMYNLGVPTTSKAWNDRLARAGKTFKYTETRPVGLLEDKAFNQAQQDINAIVPLRLNTIVSDSLDSAINSLRRCQTSAEVINAAFT